VSRKTPKTERPQQEYARKFVNALSCSSASELVTMAGFAQAIFWGAREARVLPRGGAFGFPVSLFRFN